MAIRVSGSLPFPGAARKAVELGVSWAISLAPEAGIAELNLLMITGDCSVNTEHL
jgi:hypothetical protein